VADVKELWAFRDNRIAVRFAYEWHDDSGNWFRSYGNENWEFDEHGFMQWRIASINDLPIQESDVQSTRSAIANIAVAIRVRADLTVQTTT
jgi:nuclear transport factor 2 (NTF2) superfamily protein